MRPICGKVIGKKDVIQAEIQKCSTQVLLERELELVLKLGLGLSCDVFRNST